jgi:DNA-binding protein Fis
MPLIDTIAVTITVNTEMTYSECKSALINAFLRTYLQVVMKYHQNNITKAAIALKTDRRFLGKLVKKYRSP